MPDAIELCNEGERLKDEGKLEEAVKSYEQALTVDERCVLAHLALAVLQGRLKNHEAAVEHAQKACELEPSDPFNYTAMSLTMQRAFAGTGDRKYIQMAEDAMARSHQLQGR